MEKTALGYCYIGAKWEWHKVGRNIGNSRFSISSKNPLQIPARADFLFIPKINEDDQIY